MVEIVVLGVNMLVYMYCVFYDVVVGFVMKFVRGGEWFDDFFFEFKFYVNLNLDVDIIILLGYYYLGVEYLVM